MRRLHFCYALALSALLSCIFVTAPRVRAIVYGQVDTTRAFANTGAFIVKAPNGRIFPICSGTLISPTVFLTASHCTVPYEQELAPQGYTAQVSFDGAIPFGSLTSPATNLIPVEMVFTNPNYNQRQSDPGDIAVLILPASRTTGITPATLPTAYLLDQLAAQNGLHNAVITPAGYGVQNRVNGGGQPFFEDVNPVPRMFANSTFNALNPSWVRMSQNPATGNGGACYGDSGGPNFFNHNGQRLLIALTVTGDAVCRATNVAYRLDTVAARTFLAGFINLP